MQTEFFTCGVGSPYGEMAQRLYHKYLKVNGIRINIIPEKQIAELGLSSQPYWIKCFLFDFAHPCTKRVVWLDSDIDPVSPCDIEDFNHDSNFFAVEDPNRMKIKECATHPIFNNIQHYYNMGFFMANRWIMQDLFNECKKEIGNSIRGSCIEQTWINYYLDKHFISCRSLHNKYNWLVKEYPAVPKDVMHVHYAGDTAGKKLLGGK